MMLKKAAVLLISLGLILPAQAASAPKKKVPAKTAAPAAAPAAKKSSVREDNVIESVSVQSSGKFAKVVIQSTRPLKARDIVQADGKSVSLYMTDPTLCRRPSIEKASGDIVDEIRFGYEGARIPSGEPIPLDYITFILKEPVTHTVSQREWIFQVEFRARTGSVKSAALPSIAVDADAPLTPLSQGNSLAVLPPNPALDDFVKVGLSNHVPLRLAQEEYRLAKIRSFEAARGLFPTATGRVERSEGTLLKDINIADDDIHFFRREYGVQLGQPIFHSGRIYFAWREAAARKQAAGHNVRKVQGEVSFEIIKAYRNILKSQRTLKARRELMERMDKVIELTRKKRQLELITESEALGTESQYSQAYYRLLSDEKDLEISRLRLEALLNLPEPLPAALPDAEGDTDLRQLIDLNVPVETFVDIGFKSRPEMLSADYAAVAGAYGEKGAKAETRLHVDASGFVGKAGAAYRENNDFGYKKSWNIGVQAGMFFLGNSVKGTGSKDRTAPDYGETTATDTKAQSVSVGLLDGVKLVGDRRQARIAREKAFYEREQARRNVEVEVREAYYGIQKAKIQLKGAQIELDYRRKELGITRQKERMNLVEPSQSLAAEISYGDAVNGWEEAQAFYTVSLAQLEKSVGVPLETIAELK